MVVCFCNNIIIDKFNGFNNRNNAQCPSCGSLERHRSIILFFNTNNIKCNKLLHFAPEKQLSKLFAFVSNKYICGDINPMQYRIPNIIRLDITNIEYKNEFDYIVASHVLEHIIDDRKAIKEIYNALVSSGRFIALVPQKFTSKLTYEDLSIVSESDRLKHFGQRDHVRWYGLDFSQRLKDAGFYVKIHYLEECEKYIDEMIYDEKHQFASNEDAKKYGLIKNDIIYECIKNDNN